MPRIDAETRRRLLSAARVGRLATVTGDGLPHVVPCCFVVIGSAGEERVYSVVDAKPKSTKNLKRLDNVRSNPVASLVIDRYSEDWEQLWWVRVDGPATVVEDEVERSDALQQLAAKYEQYRAMFPTTHLTEDPAASPAGALPGALLRVDIDRWNTWTASDAAVGHEPG